MTADFSARALKQVFLDEYGHFADKRQKNLDTASRFIVDDRNEGDYDARNKLFGWFCQITADVKTRDRVDLSIGSQVPKSPAVEAWLKANTSPGSYGFPAIVINRGDQSKLLELAAAIKAITARGAPRYEVKAYKFVCPRTADSLKRVKIVLDKAWNA
ncbi:hypothetical protein NKJ13_03220 [Mesorhizobium sp. M0174]|uniref:hypothetical protein n=1 Tax=unclassified Mesorhizobium TaxID=325217 RepID=UPI00333BD932